MQSCVFKCKTFTTYTIIIIDKIITKLQKQREFFDPEPSPPKSKNKKFSINFSKITNAIDIKISKFKIFFQIKPKKFNNIK